MQTTLSDDGVLTVPRQAVDAIGSAPGDRVDIRVDDGQLVLRPLPAERGTLCLTALGERKEAEADRDIAEGRVKTFDTVEELLADLNEDLED